MKGLRLLLLILAVWLLTPWWGTASEKADIGGPILHGFEPQADVPVPLRVKNVGGSDGAGLCVFTSIQYAGRYQNVEPLFDFQDKMRAEKGGGWPEKVDQMMKKYAPGIRYLQYEGKDPAVVELALKTGRLPCVTMGYSELYGHNVSHMVCCPYLIQDYGMFLDNNFIEDNQLTGMSKQEWIRRWTLGGGGWAIVLLDVGAPPPPFQNRLKDGSVLVGCGGGGCGPVEPSFPPAPVYRWDDVPGHPDQLVLLCNGVQYGNYDKDSGKFFRFTGGRFDKDCSKPPIAPPVQVAQPADKDDSVGRRGCHCTAGCQCRAGECKCRPKDRCSFGCKCSGRDANKVVEPEDEKFFFGVDRDQMREQDGVEFWSINGRPVRRCAALLEMTSGEPLPDDSQLGWIVAIDQGGKLGRELAADFALNQQLQELGKEWRFVSYSNPENLMLKDRDGVPLYPGWKGIMTLDKDGKALYQLTGEYTTKKAIELLRKSKGLDPNKVPDANTPEPGPHKKPKSDDEGDSMTAVHGCCATLIGALVVSGVAGATHFMRRKR